MACWFESMLAVAALLLGWLLDIQPYADLRFTETAALLGVAGTLPLLLIFMGMQYLPIPAVKQIKNMIEGSLGQSLIQLHWLHLLILALVAGFSEELLFRGLLQPWLEKLINLSAALIISNLVFGLVHAVTPLYALFAILTGLYLGWSLDCQGERNLLIPMIIHTLYDFVAFLIILRNFRKHFAQAD